jgi:hypothetical protein
MRIDLKSLLEQKNNVYDHIFYEFSMYNNSFSALLSVVNCDETQLPDKQFWMNVLLESHATHLRNLIHFFSGKDSISAITVLRENPHLGISDADGKCKIIDQAISHITIERVTSATGNNSLTKRIDDLIKRMYPEMCSRIAKYLQLLSDESKINEQYMSEFKTNEIQIAYQELSKLFIKRSDPAIGISNTLATTS